MKFENKLRDKLEERQLRPSEDAWNRLSKQLDDHRFKSKNKGYWWLGIAASLILMLVILLDETKTPVIPESIVVDVEDVVEPTENETQIVNQELIATQNANEIEEQKIRKLPNQLVLQQKLKKEEKLEAKTMDEVVAKVDNKEHQSENSREVLSFEEQKAVEVVAQIELLKKQSTQVTNAEIDALLATAQREIQQKRLYDQATKKVDAHTLLQSVEDDLDQSFRERVFKMLYSGYQNVKTAVAERNN